jgi:hypothetical protein
VIRRGRLLSGALLLSAFIVVALAAGAQANHSTLAHVSQGTIGGTDPFISYFPSGGTSADGGHAFFETDEKLLPEDTDGSFDVYERTGGATSRVSKGAINGNGAFEAFFDATSADGARAFFETDEKLQSTDTDSQVDVYERSGGSTSQVSIGQGGTGNGAFGVFFNAISAGGTKVFFTTEESLVPADTDNCLSVGCDDVYERSGGTTTLVSAGGNANFPATFVGASDGSSHVFFETSEQLSASDTDSKIDVYDRSGGTTTLVSTGTPGNGAFDSFFEGTSTGGTKVFFSTAEQLAGTDTDGSIDVYERSGGSTTQVSTAAGNPNGTFNATYDGNSTDGSRVFFHTNEVMAGSDTDAQTDIYQRSGGSTTQISTGSTGGNGTFGASFEANSADGSRVFFSTAEKLENPPDTDNSADIYQRLGSTTSLVSIGSAGGNGAVGSFFDGISADGSRPFFSTSEKLEAPDTDSSTDVYERFNLGTSLISIGPNGGNGAFGVTYDQASDDGAHVFFSTDESLISATDTDTSADVYDAGAPVGYARPKGASPVSFRLVPAFKACSSGNASHGVPLASSSCSPPVQASDFLTVGAPDANGNAANSAGLVELKVLGETPIDPLNGDQADVQIKFEFSDARKKSDLSEYTGELQGVLGLRITDRYNGPTQTAPATVSDLSVPFTVACASTPSPSIGGACNLTTTVDTLSPGTAREAQRAIWQLQQVKVNDGGPDGDVDTADNTLFAVQGAFAP